MLAPVSCCFPLLAQSMNHTLILSYPERRHNQKLEIDTLLRKTAVFAETCNLARVSFLRLKFQISAVVYSNVIPAPLTHIFDCSFFGHRSNFPTKEHLKPTHHPYAIELRMSHICLSIKPFLF